ncbi:PEP-CTERM sorting domain-containing protein [Pseudoduganella chitinolytica]|uniref:PEP-CTERM sorting domain-containing protein n=1 Tax=Pseudoduganella chitinolytica TaxID=34070 RepID=A0ABY8BJD3_9BURK|nr:PEP-CTERM sorting domain-containing protein [Pseudoduganella chitinolytica]WEF35453.1 PEP-CTERM sorting domain-containing protein [Pseudoduganella chitinolytica]
MLVKACMALLLSGVAALASAAPMTLTVNGSGTMVSTGPLGSNTPGQLSMTIDYDTDSFHGTEAFGYGAFGAASLTFTTAGASYTVTSVDGADLLMGNFGDTRPYLSLRASFQAQEQWGNQEAGLTLYLDRPGALTPPDLLTPRVVTLDNLAGATLWLQTRDNGGELFAEHDIAFDNVTVTIASAVPEPATYAMVFAGLGIVGAAAARRRRVG